MILKKNSTLLFIGDSITDSDRIFPIGRRFGLGDGYVNLIESLLEINYPEKNIKILNLGISGNRVIDLESRWKNDVIKLKPDWLVILIGDGPG